MHKTIGLALALLVLSTAVPAKDLGKDIERGLGKMVADELESTYGVVDDPLLAGWVNRMGQQLAAVSGRTDVKYSFKVLDADDINAVSCPGGYIYVNRGALRFVQSEDELASVLGHEVGHVAGRHAMKQLNAQLLGTLALIGFQSVHAETLRIVGSLAGGLAMLKYSRDQENDADRRGLHNATAAGYDGKAMLTFFQRMETTEKEKPSSLEVYFLTHPPTPVRLTRIEKEPGTQDNEANAIALGDGYAARSLYREAADSYRRALKLDPDNSDLKRRLADSYCRVPQKVSARPLTSDDRALRLKQLSAFGDELDAARDGLSQDDKKLGDAQKGMDNELELAAQSLTSASQMIGPRDTVQYREFVRMARSFDQATRVSGNLRAARDMVNATLAEMSQLRMEMQHAVEAGDGAAANQVDGLVMVSHEMLKNLTGGLHQARNQAGDARQAASTLHMAADSLINAYRMPLTFTSGQVNILDLQVSTAQDSMRDAVTSSHRSVSQVARARMEMTLRRIDFLTRSVAPDDAETSGIVAHYLGVEPADVRAMRSHVELGDAALALAADQMQKAREARKKDKHEHEKAAAPSEPQAAVQPENASVLFNLIAHDLEREIATQ